MDPVLAWLLDPADPAVRAETLLRLEGRPPTDVDVVAARRDVAERGSAARTLAGLAYHGLGENELYRPKYGAPFHRLIALAEMGVPASVPAAGDLLAKCLDAFFGRKIGDFVPKDQETCLTGNLARAATLMGRADDARVARAFEWLLDAQLADGGWHCWPDKDPRGTLDAWEALSAFEAVPARERPARMREAISRGVEHFVAKKLGMDDPYEPWHRLHFPRHYYYDALVGLELATSLGDPRDERLAPALEWLVSKRGADGRWSADAAHPDLGEGADYTLKSRETVTPLVVEEAGAPSKWLTLRALVVLTRSASAARA